MSRFRRGSSLANADLREVLESDAVAILLDSTKLGRRPEDGTVGPMDRYDTAGEGLPPPLQRARPPGRRPPPPPRALFSQLYSLKPHNPPHGQPTPAPPPTKKTR